MIKSGELNSTTSQIIHLDTLGIINGCADFCTQAPYWVEMAYNNTYGIQFITKEDYEHAMDSYYKPGGCKDAYTKCHTLEQQLDPEDYGNVEEVNAACMAVGDICKEDNGVLLDRSPYDIAHPVSFFVICFLEH